MIRGKGCFAAGRLATKLGISRRQVTRLMETGIIPAYKLGNMWFVKSHEIAEARGRARNTKRGPKKGKA
jgi:hypothetical protein